MDIFEKMEKAMEFCERNQGDFQCDKEVLMAESDIPDNYLWIVRKNGTLLLPYGLATATGSSVNQIACDCAEEDIRAYKVQVDDMTEGRLEEIVGLRSHLETHSRTPVGLTVKYELHDGEEGNLYMKWTSRYLEEFLDHMDLTLDEVRDLKVTDVYR